MKITKVESISGYMMSMLKHPGVGELVYNETPPATVLTYRCRRGYLHLKAKLKHSMLSTLIIFYFELSPLGTFKFHRVTLIIDIVIYVN